MLLNDEIAGGHGECDTHRSRVSGSGQEGQGSSEAQPRIADLSAPSSDEIAGGHASSAPPFRSAAGSGQEGHPRIVDQTSPADLSAIIAEIRAFHRERIYAMEQRKRADLALGAFVRMALGWSLALPEAERKAVATRAADLIDACEKQAKGKPADASDPQFPALSPVVLASIAARAPFDQVEKAATKRLEQLAKQLPVWSWCEPVKGFGANSLATIVGEAGDLSAYDGPAKLWKRMGVAVLDGTRQGGLAKTAPKDAWIAHGYNRSRRSRMWNVGKAMIYAGGPYADLYRARKEQEVAKAEAEGLTVAPAGSIPKKRAAEFRSKGHIDKRAQRYMEKRLLRDLWRAWRDAAKQQEGTNVSA